MKFLNYILGVAIALPVVCALGASAHADEGEMRLSLHLGGELAELSGFESSGSNGLVGGGGAVAHGFRNWLDAGFAFHYTRKGDAVIDDAVLDGVGGTPPGVYSLFTDVQTFRLAATARTYLEAGPFLRLRPLLGFRAGGEVTQFGSPQLFASDAPASGVGDSEWELALFGGAEVGLAYRLTDAFEGALLLTADHSSVQTSFGVTLEVSWQRL